MVEKVVYFLGAGFSAPLGLPVMNDFLVKSKDMYFEDPEHYGHFKDVFDTVNEMSVAKSYFETDLFNIEEILSILEMRAQLQGDRLAEPFLKYLSDVLLFHMPRLISYPGSLPSNWPPFIFGRDDIQNCYGVFAASLLNLKAELCQGVDNKKTLLWRRTDRPTVRYDVISVNYDLVLENYCKFVQEQQMTEHPIRFNRGEPPTGVAVEDERPRLLKLHGSIDTGVIIPPTWSKAVDQSILQQWSVANSLLAEANHIRVLGYSLPESDAYVKYLFKASVVESPHLKSFDVICLDPDGTVRARYDRFVNFKYYRFANADMVDYLQAVRVESKATNEVNVKSLVFDAMEKAHSDFMKELK